MASRYILQIALLLSFTTSLSLSYDLLQLQQQQRSSNSACLKLLRQVKGKPEHCQQDRMDFKFPEEIKQPRPFQKEMAALVIQEMLQNIFVIIRKEFATTVWNKTIVDDLLDKLHQQMDRLKSTILQERPEDTNMTTLRLKSYYWRISRYLTARENSICAWTVVQAELISKFPIINSLTDYFQD
ncbi:interferon beta [Cavia porcellus]|uniref:interferon beta n=1 Tax=Cavia porcellus TaxID=10141 RepID=UPI002FE2C866